MAATAQELRDKRNTVLLQAQEINNKALAEGRVMTAEEQQLFDKAFKEADDFKAQYTAIETTQANANRIKAELEAMGQSRGRQAPPIQPEGQTPQGEKPYQFMFRGESVELEIGSSRYTNRHSPEMRSSYKAWIRQGRLGAGEAYHNANINAGQQTDIDTSGGYLVAVEEFVAGLLKNLDDQVFIRGLATKYTTMAQTLGIRKQTQKMSAWGWGSEITPLVPGTDLKFGKKVLTPHYMGGMCLISRDLLMSGVMNVEQILRDEMARDAGELEELAFLFGDGNQKPLGLFVASDDGISTNRDVSEGNTATNFTFDGLTKAKYSLKQYYRNRAKWLFHRDSIYRIATLKDGNGQYLWQPSRTAGDPDSVLGLPVIESEWVPNTFTTGKYVGMLADFSEYVIGDSLQMAIQRLEELYALSGQIAFLARRKVDGMPRREEAFSRVKLG